MKNITLSIEEEVLTVVRRYAAERNRTVNSLVRDFLRQIASQEDRVKKARQKIRELSARSPARLGSKNWRREYLYER